MALVLIFLLVEETKRRSLEELDHVFAVSKCEFMRFQVFEYLPWLVNRFLLGRRRKQPEMYKDLVWGSADGDGASRMGDVDGDEASHTLSEWNPSTIGTPVHIALAMMTPEVSVATTYHDPNAVEIGDSRPLKAPQSPLSTQPPQSPLPPLSPQSTQPPLSPLSSHSPHSPPGSHPSHKDPSHGHDSHATGTTETTSGHGQGWERGSGHGAGEDDRQVPAGEWGRRANDGHE